MSSLAFYIVITGLIGTFGLFLFLVNFLKGISSYYKDYSELPQKDYDLNGIISVLESELPDIKYHLKIVYSNHPDLLMLKPNVFPWQRTDTLTFIITTRFFAPPFTENDRKAILYYRLARDPLHTGNKWVFPAVLLIGFLLLLLEILFSYYLFFITSFFMYLAVAGLSKGVRNADLQSSIYALQKAPIFLKTFEKLVDYYQEHTGWFTKLYYRLIAIVGLSLVLSPPNRIRELRKRKSNYIENEKG